MRKTILEFDSICGRDLPEGHFEELLEFVEHSGSADLLKVMVPGYRRGIGRTLTARNHVGSIHLSDGTVIEILPKIGDSIGADVSRSILLTMLREVHDLPMVELGDRLSGSDEIIPFEFFIRMFIKETYRIVDDGLCRSYNDIEANESALRGRIDFTENIKRNLVHRERFCQEYQLLNEDRAENRLIRSTLDLLYGISIDQDNRRDLNDLTSWFGCVEPSINIQHDLEMVRIDRGMENYAHVLDWCRLFLENTSFTFADGCNRTRSFLFQMDILYERFVASLVRKLGRRMFRISTQDSGTRLFEERDSVRLRPDIVLRDGERTIVIDTKWKRIMSHRDISVSDLYQMYAYSIRFRTERTILLYPDIGGCCHPFTDSINGVRIEVRFIDMLDAKRSMERLLQDMSS